MESEPDKFSLKTFWIERKAIVVTFLILFAVSLPCCCLLGFRTNWILWQLGLR